MPLPDPRRQDNVLGALHIDKRAIDIVVSNPGYVDSVKLGDITVETFNFSEDIQKIKQKS